MGIKNPSFKHIKKFFDENLNCRYVKQDDQKVWKHVYHEGRFVGIFQMANEGARNFCVEAKPTRIEDFAAITAIYRPGPLKANVHKKYVQAKRNPSSVKYEHPIIKEVLGDTMGEIVFQEQFMILGQKMGGFSPGEADQMRKTLVKKSLDTVDKKSSEKEQMRQKFVTNAQKLHGIDPKISNVLFDRIEFFAAYGFNLSHAIAYAIDSYYSAWLHTHYEKEWLSTILESANNNPDELKKTIAEIKSYGYKFSNVDINFSNTQWEFSEEINAFVPPLNSVKRVGKAAVEEIIYKRPYKNFYELFYDEHGEWKNSKLNKACFEALAKVEGFSSFEEFKNGKLKNHKQIWSIISEDKNYDLLKKNIWGLSNKKISDAKKQNITLKPYFDSVLEEKYSDLEDWTREEKISQSFEVMSTVDEDLIFPKKLMEKFNNKSVKPATQIPPDTTKICWICPTSIEMKKTKTGKQFYKVQTIDNEFKISNLRVWGVLDEEFKPYTIWLAEVKNEKLWGLSTNSFKIKKLV